MTGIPVTIEKNGTLVNVDEHNLAKGDVVVLQPGDHIPADLDLIEAKGLEVDAFKLTGELLPVRKSVDDADPRLYQGSRVVKGSAKGVVLAIGDKTEYGKVSRQETAIAENRRIKFIGKHDAWWLLFSLPLLPLLMISFSHALVGFLFYLLAVIGILIVKHRDLHHHLLKVIHYQALKGMQIRLRNFDVLEQVKDINLVCFDKTGVLTQREMQVRELAFVDGKINARDGLQALGEITADRVKTACALCHDTWFYEKIETGNLVDRAIIHYAQQQGANLQEMLRAYERIYDQPFTSESRYMACGYRHPDHGDIYLVKGDPLVLLSLCQFHTTMEGTQEPIDARHLLAYRRTVVESNRNGHKAIALAYASDESALASKGFTILCILQLENPMKTGVKEVIRKISMRGIRCMLLTGDSAEAALWAAEESGIDRTGGYLTGPMLNRMAFSEISRQISHCSILARLTPSQKGLVIRLLQQKGQHVAMIGNGFNDGIALKVADVGISFHQGSSPVARRHSGIWINELRDLVEVFKQASRYEKACAWINVIRWVIIITAYATIYLWGWQYFSTLIP